MQFLSGLSQGSTENTRDDILFLIEFTQTHTRTCRGTSFLSLVDFEFTIDGEDFLRFFCENI
jgi:hypothetical protein